MAFSRGSSYNSITIIILNLVFSVRKIVVLLVVKLPTKCLNPIQHIKSLL